MVLDWKVLNKFECWSANLCESEIILTTVYEVIVERWLEI